jgi:hypothetical protein
MAGDVDSDFAQRLNCFAFDGRRIDSSALYRKVISGIMAQQTFCHLAAR